ncbi:class I SAM-dependent methyltransferase [Marivirga harenae]|uniref:class I SAM-dependent methyltransferase n=1 Tax=Marivirga harenae TaxID=2010992 RepID=UPI0026E0D6B7|nr:class I SAM-dependent methyltransferase [Marivirga harenae]WKV13794.1 class I SAM-dependent methyltransferase [Marivirga harenae]|tara:strand:+ start:95623 stop:96321 length:699 start_codon:yes stop_codon:yes gene_type:complete
MNIIRKKILKQQQLLEDIYADSLVLQQLLKGFKTYIPWTQYAIRPFAISIVLNDLILNNRKYYLEFGSGVSTFLAAKLVQLNSLDCKIVSVEHDDAWLQIVKDTLEKEGLAHLVELVHVPLRSQENELISKTVNWYDREDLKFKLPNYQYDAILVDGPPGEKKMNRFPAIEFLNDHSLLASDLVVYLDDFNRLEEKKIVKYWEEILNIKFDSVLNKIAIGTKGKGFKVRLHN